MLSMNFFLLVNVKMPTIGGILTFMSKKNSTIGLSEPEKCWISCYFYTYELLKFMLSWLGHDFFISSGSGFLQYTYNCMLTSEASDLKVYTQNLPRITFTMSCHHFPPKHIFKFLVNQCWKLIQRCSLKISLSFLSPLFNTCIGVHVWVPLKFAVVGNMCRRHLYVQAYINLGLKNQFFTLLFLYQQTYVSLGYNRVSGNFSAQIVLHSFCNGMLKTELISELSIMLHVFKLFLYGIYMVAILSKFWVVWFILQTT